jgi:esterase/lipase
MVSHLCENPMIDNNMSFEDYIAACRALIKSRRTDLTPENNDKIIDANAPFELPVANPSAGVLFIHGLLDSPFTARDICTGLQTSGVLCRAMLLPGHGTTPNDLLTIRFEDWLQAVRYNIESLSKEVEHIYLIGYSTGALLSIHYALQNQKIAGVILLSPAIRIKKVLDLALNLHQSGRVLSKEKEWVHQVKEIDYAKYRSVCFNAALQVKTLAQLVATELEATPLACPVLMIVSEDDETISCDAAINFFTNTHHAHSQLVVYSTVNSAYIDKRTITRNSHYPEWHIDNFSHVAIPFAPTNPHYGQTGDYALASHSNTRKYTYRGYNRAIEKTYEGLYRLGLIKRMPHELTYNPDFSFMMERIKSFILTDAASNTPST